MKILMTGATGLIGRELGKKLVREGHTIRALTRNPKAAQITQCFPATFFKWDGEKEPVPTEALQGVDVVINLAGEGIADRRWSEQRKKQLVDSRVGATRRLGESLSQSGIRPRLYIGASAIGLYGDKKSFPLVESAGPGEGFLPDLCRNWEAAHLGVAAESHTLIRIGVVLSERGGFLAQVAPLFQKLGASRLGSGEQYISWIHIDDLVQVFLDAIAGKISGVINGTAPNPVTNAEMTKALAKALHVVGMPPVPSLGLKLLYGELSQVLLEGQKVVPQILNESGFKFQYPRVESALEALRGDLGPGEQTLVTEVWLKSPRSEVFQFFCDERNLEKITPPEMLFKVLSRSTDQIQKGTLIDYDLRIRGVPVRWRTLIAEFVMNSHFVDEQLKGPYTKWRHLHTFEDLAGGTLMRDVVVYKVPMGLLGRWAASPLVDHDVREIFKFRSGAIRQFFGDH